MHAPDWRSEERVAYTLRLAEILGALLPDGVDGTISTNPLSYGAWLDDDGLADATRNMVPSATSCAARGSRWRSSRRPTARSPTIDDLIRWWPTRCDATVCFDACHSAVAYEDPDEVLDALDAAGIRVGKAQLSAALTVPGERARGAAGVRRPDLPAPGDRAAGRCARGPTCRRRWRPTAAATSGACTSTCRSSSSATARWSRRRTTCGGASSACDTAHLEIETYTWDVLPADLKASSVDSIAREYEWVLDVLG